jgi:ABC-type methionine transport system permease subunit
VKHDLSQSGPFIGVGGLAVAAFLYGYSAFALPSVLHSVVMPLLWLASFVLGCIWFTRRPTGIIALPVVMILLWFALLLGLR